MEKKCEVQNLSSAADSMNCVHVDAKLDPVCAVFDSEPVGEAARLEPQKSSVWMPAKKEANRWLLRDLRRAVAKLADDNATYEKRIGENTERYQILKEVLDDISRHRRVLRKMDEEMEKLEREKQELMSQISDCGMRFEEITQDLLSVISPMTSYIHRFGKNQRRYPDAEL